MLEDEVPARLLQGSRAREEGLHLLRVGLLDPRPGEDSLRGRPLRALQLHRKAGLPAPHPRRHAGGIPLLLREERACPGRPVPRGRPLEGRHLPHHRLHRRLPALRYLGRRPAPGKSAHHLPALHPAQRSGLGGEVGPAPHPLRDDGPPCLQHRRSRGLLEGPDGGPLRRVPRFYRCRPPPGHLQGASLDRWRERGTERRGPHRRSRSSDPGLHEPREDQHGKAPRPARWRGLLPDEYEDRGHRLRPRAARLGLPGLPYRVRRCLPRGDPGPHGGGRPRGCLP